MADMTIAEFIRLRSDAEDDPASTTKRSFVCELPDVDGERCDAWLHCGRVVALATHGRLRVLEVELNDVFERQFENTDYGTEEVLGVIILWVGWESKWAPLDRVRIRLRDPQRAVDCVYDTATDRVRCGRESHEEGAPSGI
jgi:hypothetical protein